MDCYLCNRNLRKEKTTDYWDKGLLHKIHVGCLPSYKVKGKNGFIKFKPHKVWSESSS